MSDAATAEMTWKDFQTDQDVRWCPGCGDYAILKAVQSVFPDLGVPKERFVVISGIGCSSRFPYYMDTFGFHTIHGRAPALASGLKMTRPDLEVWVATGDGDAMSIGGNHLIHALRRNVGLKILMFNNRIYGLTKGQYSPTSERGKRTSSTPAGSLDNPFNPLALALGAGATFVARAVDIFVPHLKEVLKRAAAHQGSAFIEIYQNCNIFNDEAFAHVTDKENRKTQVVYLEHGEPLVFADGAKGIVLDGLKPRVVDLAGGEASAEDCVVWDETDPTLAYFAAQLLPPAFPTPLGVLRAVEEATYESAVVAQIEAERERQGDGRLEELLRRGDVWTVGEDGSIREGSTA
ncbi:MAG TPA: 2-oxoacid:ferredoxin oxidoreductase subunit beta [Thermoanaerobaculia bacterium]|nr:2-oxoacid:ferredoxin oxidoreductase subunit beta [Thermoanaerobaculia bacterium]